MKIEEEYMDVLQNIEFAVALHYREHPDTTDYSVARVYEALNDFYTAEKIGREPRPWKPTKEEQLLFDQTKEMCEWRLGRNTAVYSDEEILDIPSQEIDIDTLQLCLKRLRKSVKMWTKNYGRQGYLEYMTQFVR